MKKIRSKLSLALLPVVVFPLLALGLHSMFLLERLSQENSAAQFKLLLDYHHDSALQDYT